MVEKKQKNIFLDVRSPAEFETAHIKGSYNIPLEELIKHRKEISKINKNIILICRTGNRAKIALGHLNKEGIKNVEVMEGGITECNGKEMKTGKQKWDIERQVRFVAGSLVVGGIVLGYLTSPLFFLFSGLVGLGLAYSSLTNSCIMGMCLMKLPYNKSTKKVDVKKLIRELRE